MYLTCINVFKKYINPLTHSGLITVILEEINILK